MKTPKLKLAVIAVAAAFAGNAAAIDFLATYRLARQSDAAFAASRASLEAGLEKLPQGRALLLPVINGTANTTWNEANNITNARQFGFNSNGYNVTLTQPLFRWQNIVQYKQSEFQVLQSEAQFGQATQDLIVRVAQAYFDVLAAQDNLDFTKANKIAIAEQLAQAKRNFEVGTATITDTNEAQARFDLAGAQEIAGLNALEVAWRALQQIIGEVPNQLTPLKAVAMTAPVPNVMDDWAKAARGNNFVVRGNEAVFEIATKEIARQRAGHYPTVDVVGSFQDNRTVNPAAVSAGANIPRIELQQSAIALQLTLPIFAGGSVLSRTREAVALQEKARQDLEASRRAAEFNARQSYLNVTNGLAQVKALEQALVSSETALQSNRVGYEVGVRINIDVLNAQQQVFQTKRDLARARYDTILNGLRLKSAAGSLTESDVDLVNVLLGFDAAEPLPITPPKTGMIDMRAPATAAAASSRRSEPVVEKAAAPVVAPAAARAAAPAPATRAKRETAQTRKAAPAARTVEARAEPTPPATERAAPVVTPIAASPAPVEKALETPAPEAVAATAPVEKTLETSTPRPVAAAAPVEKALETPATTPAAAATPVETSPPADAAIVPVAMPPSAALEKSLPAPEIVAPATTPKTATKKDTAKTAAQSVSPHTTKTTRGTSVATASPASTASTASSTAAAAAPVEQAPDEAPVRVYSVVEPKIPGSRRTAPDQQPVATTPAPEPRQD